SVNAGQDVVGIATDVFVKAGHVIVGCVDVNETSDTYSGIAVNTAERLE
ncbi:MAG: hypothetical protein RL409_937, partial [Gemmatimonadota bacterium]